MRVAILHNEPGANAADQDVMLQMHCVKKALMHAGHACIPMVCSLDLGSLAGRLHDERIDVVFNLVESLGGTDRLSVAAPLILETIGIPFTGAGALAMHLTSDKVLAKRIFKAAGLPTPRAVTLEDRCAPAGRYIVKTRFEHASIGMDDAAVVDVAGVDELHELIRSRTAQSRREMFAESYIDGREFNLSIVNGTVLPPAEIDFSSFPPEKPRIVGYKAKWDDDSFEFNHTPRRFRFDAGDSALLESLTALSVRAWKELGLTGYARVDYRVDPTGNPWVLEVNTNPCLSPDAGLAAAVMEAGMEYDELICSLLDAAVREKGR